MKLQVTRCSSVPLILPLYSSLPNAMLTLFQLFTLDQWVQIYSDLVEVSNQAVTSTYILLWVWVGAFLFRNLFVGIMGQSSSPI